MHNHIRYITHTIFLLITCFAMRVSAQRPVKTSAAAPEVIQKAQAAVEADPDNQKLHRTFIYAMGMDNTVEIVNHYKAWMNKDPKNVNIPLAVGTVFYNAEMPQGKDFLLRVVEMQPKNAKVLLMLAADALYRGQDDLSVTYIKKATLADPTDDASAASYLASFKKSDPVGYEQKVFEFIKRFPNSDAGASALYWLGQDATNLADKIKYFEDLRKLYHPQKSRWSADGMVTLTDVYLQTNLQKALALINEMGDGKDWKIRKQVADALISISKLEQDHNYKAALAELEQVKLPGFNYIAEFVALKKAALRDKAGDFKAAYDSLAVRYAKLPTDQLEAALLSSGTKIGKSKELVMDDIKAIRNKAATPAYPFELGLYTSSGKLNLQDLKGKVVLLTFWFPGCNPCREEFPHFQEVINKFKSDKVAYVGINVFPEQDPYVIPFMNNSKFSFTPLRGNQDLAKLYGANGEPTNFLIDKDGKVIFKDFMINSNNQRTLELMISSLL